MSSLVTVEHNFHPKYRPDIDGLRAIAILSVVSFHAFPLTFKGGFAGVDVFFVISGFLISSILFMSLQRGDFSFTEFYAHRVRRIFPALILVLTASFAFGWFVLLPDEYEELGKHVAAGAGFVQNFVLWKEAGYFDTASELKPLMHLWSLAIEEQFYLFYPLLLWAAWRMRLNVVTLVVLIGLLSFALNVNGIEKDAVKTFYLLHTRMWELIAGGAVAYLHFIKRGGLLADWPRRGVAHAAVFRNRSSAPKHYAVLINALSAIGLLMIVASVIGLHKGKPFPGWWALVPVIGTILLLAAPGAWINRKILSNRLMIFVGLISYPLYLWHWPLLSFARIVESETPSWKIRIAAVTISIVLAWCTYHFLERPIRFGHKTTVRTAILCILVTIIGLAGFVSFLKNGLPIRLKPFLERNEQFLPGGDKIAMNACARAYPNLNGLCVKQKAEQHPTIIMLGDSHSGRLYLGLAELTRDTSDNAMVIFGGGCPPFFNVASYQKGATDNCAKTIQQALLFSEDSDSVTTIVLASRGPLYLSGKGYRNGNSEQESDRVIALIDKPDISDFRHVFEVGMKATLDRLTKKRKNVIFVLDVPELGFDPKSCIESRPWRLTNQIRNPCAVSRQDFEKRNREYRILALAVLKDYPSVQIFDAAAHMCDDMNCWAIRDDTILYRDDDHLSIEGSRYIARQLMKLIKPSGHP